MLVITEIGELVQADRKGKVMEIGSPAAQKLMENDMEDGATFEEFFEDFVKDSLEDEMADVAIRLLDLAGKCAIEIDESCVTAWPFEEYSFTESACQLCYCLTGYAEFHSKINYAIAFIREWAKHLDIDLEWHIEQKMRYNETRPVKHGKKY